VNIREGGIDMLLEIYKELRVIMDDYITGPGGTIYMKQVRHVHCVG
jgi:5'-3' exonuclease